LRPLSLPGDQDNADSSANNTHAANTEWSSGLATCNQFQVRQFDEWNLEVYGKIQGRVAEQLDSVASNELTRRRNKEFQKFLDTTNTKGAIFRDIIIESEYDPLEPNRQCIKVRTVISSHGECPSWLQFLLNCPRLGITY